MARDERDVEFVSTIERERAILQGTAFLLLDDPSSAADVLDATLAQLYARRVAPAEVRLATLRSLVRDEARPVLLPWTSVREFELLDGPPSRTSTRVVTSGIVADLGRLPREQRTVIVLERFTELPSSQIADVLDRPVDEVLALARQARAALTAGLAERHSDDHLADELRSAIPYDCRVARGAVTDLANGQRLIRRGRLRRASVAIAAMVALIVLVSQLWPQPVTVPMALAPSIGPTPVTRASCDASGKVCQAAILQEWRSGTARVINSHLDPDGKNPFGYTRSKDDHDQTPAFWSGQGGALTLELFRIDQGVTQVRVQIASSGEFAWACGATTHTTCFSTRFMDGNSFMLSDAGPRKGIEVQYTPYSEVITVIASNTTAGKTTGVQRLTIIPADLIDLVKDDRLRLPDR